MKRFLTGFILFVLASTLLFGETVILSNDYDLQTTVLRSNDERTIIEFRLGHFQTEDIAINGESYKRLEVEGEPFLTNEGEPELPYVNRSIIIPNRAKTEVVFLEGEYKDFEMKVIPSKGMLYRYQDPDTIPYQFGKVYEDDIFYPKALTDLSEPFIFRDFRGQTVTFYPFQYNPTSGTVRVYKRMIVEVRTIGEDTVNVLERTDTVQSKEFIPLYQRIFLNYQPTRYPFLDEIGRMIVISYGEYIDAIQPYVDWKNQKGIDTELYVVSDIGTTALEIKDFILEEYLRDNRLTYVQLVGNHTHIPTFWVRQGAADPVYSLLAGNDNYPDIFVGRFSAYNVGHVETQVARTIHYERDIETDAIWLDKAVGIASGEGNNPSDIQHMNAIRQSLLGFTYGSVDQIYPPNATSARVTDAVNEGRGIINYAGHGSDHSWTTTGFNSAAVNRLVNDYKLPFLFSVACKNGNFSTFVTCYGEAWVRAVNDTTNDPTGGVAFYGSSVNQLWYPPLTAQGEANRLLVNDLVHTFGGFTYNGSSRMIENWGNQGADEFKNWIIFGDASLQLRTDIPEEMIVMRMPEIFVGSRYYEVETNVPGALVSLSHNSRLIAAGYTDQTGNITFDEVDFPLELTTVAVTITAYNYVTYIGDLNVVPNEGPYVVINDVEVLGEGQNPFVNYGDIATVNLSLRNVGVQTAVGITARVATDNRYVAVIDSTRFFSDIEPLEIMNIQNAFTLRIADNIPNGQLVIMNVLISEAEGESWQWRFNFRVNAPELIAGTILIDDSQYGNSNGRIDPGETVVLTIPTINNGAAGTGRVNVSFVSGNDDLTLDSASSIDLPPILDGLTVYPTFTVTISDEINSGSVIPIGIAITSGMYSTQRTYRLSVGAITEDFESGNFATFDWEFYGNEPWIIDSVHVYEGSYAAGSGDIGGSQLSGMSLTLNVTEPGFISFWRRVSSESNYDFLKFRINNEVKGQWSGEVPWSQVSYPVEVGENNFRWEYVKDILWDHGYDQAWVDFIQFPTSGSVFEGPIFLAYPTELDFGTINIGMSKDILFHIRNFGNQEMVGTIEIYEGFQLIEIESSVITGNYRNGNRNVFDYRINPESNIPFKISFSPTEERNYSGFINITSNAANQPEIAIGVIANGGILSTDETDLPALVTELRANYPNPFNPTTTISYSLSTRDNIKLEIYNILGQRITTLIDEVKDAGNHSIVWDGSNHSGAKVASGVYFYRMKTKDYERVRRMVYLK